MRGGALVDGRVAPAAAGGPTPAAEPGFFRLVAQELGPTVPMATGSCEAKGPAAHGSPKQPAWAPQGYRAGVTGVPTGFRDFVGRPQNPAPSRGCLRARLCSRPRVFADSY